MTGTFLFEEQLKIDEYLVFTKVLYHETLVFLRPVDLGMLFRNSVVVANLKVIGLNLALSSENNTKHILCEVEFFEVL